VTTIVALLNGLLNALFDALCWPLKSFDPLWAMVWISLLTGVLMVWIFGKVSNQDGIKRAKDKIYGNIYGVLLFQDDVGVILRLQGRILRHILTYMKYSLIPMVILMIPVILIIIQLNLRFSVQPFEPGDSVLLKVKVRDASALDRPIALDLPGGIEKESPAVRIPSEREVAWRLRAQKPGEYPLAIRFGEDTVEKQILVGSRWGKTSARRPGAGVLDVLLWPGEAPLERSAPVESIEIDYPTLPLSVFGWNVHWLVAFFILSIVFGFAVKDFFGVQV